MKLYLIEAEKNRDCSPTSDWRDYSTNTFLCPSLALPTLAALTPAGIDVSFFDEKVCDLDLDDVPDAVAISFKSMSSIRAYALAEHYRSRGAKVILGGIHVSLVPDEARAHADSIVIGEAERVWPHLMRDLLAHALKPSYKAERLTDLTTLPIPRFDLLDSKKYYCHSVQTSRGCSIGCEFCPTHEMFGGVFRTKSVEQVVNEIEAAQKMAKKTIFFTDDIFGGGQKEFTLALLKELRRMKIEFVVISDFLVLDKDIVVALARSGCTHMALNIPGTCTALEVRAIKMIQALGIDVWGYFMFGFRFHEKDIFEKVDRFIKATKMQNVSFTVMAPYPNTKAGKKFAAEGRLLTKDWSLYDQAHVVCVPEKLSAEYVEEGFQRIKKELGYLSHFYSERKRSIWKKCISAFLIAISVILPNPSKPDLVKPS